ncbi:MAG: SDR family oxidoreductase [Bacteroidetes bacterium]|nr:SDR family oxidoreductase [Bacteroidota bacterium]
MLSLKDKVIVITGAKGLLGRSIVTALQSASAEVVCVDIAPGNEDKYYRVADTTSEEQVRALVQSIVKDFGRIDGWVNNAYPRTSDWGNKLEDIKMDSWRKNVDMHLNSYFMCCQIVLGQMKEQRQGALVNMSSIYGLVGPDFSIYEGTPMTMPAAYSAIKGGLVNLTRYLAAYFGPSQVRVNCVSPGGIFDNQPEPFVQQYEKKVPLRRLGKPADIAPGVAFLLSDDASYISGHNLVIDGGWTAI